ncbi:Hypothetical protein AA314_06421 [Archangium gephyra]|uniref:Uncharacterized protein n=1 Tax=Archangium gephyra TaxID=48 RepID=A0AAC8QBW7_9BACT|nr:Hypothetical protein AA314_06421 [Archangium gephyra]
MAAEKPAPAAAAQKPVKALVRNDRDTFEATGAPGVAKLRQGLAAAGKTIAAEAPRPAAPPPPPKTVSGEERAKKEVDVKTVADRRVETEDAQKKLREETGKQADDILAMADGKAVVPPGTEVKKLSDTEAELVRKDDQGGVLERTVASKGQDGAVTLDSATYANGVNKRDRMEVLAGGGTRVRHAEWKGETNEASGLKSFEDISKARDRNLVYSDTHVRVEDDRLKVDEYSQADGAIKGSRTSFYQQKGDKGIDNKLDKPFDYKKPVDRADTYSYAIPAPNADGTQGNPQYQRTQDFSQDNVKATSIVNRELDGHTKYAGEGPHNREDADRVRDEYSKHGGEDYDANDGTQKGKTPKQWFVEVQKGPDAKDTQTFIEGSPKATVVTHLSREGSQVRESSSGKTFKPGSGDLADVNGETTRTYAQDGSIEKMDMKRKEADGTELEQHYASTRTPTDKGLELSETLETKRTKDEKTFTSKKEDTSLLSGQGVRLLGSRSTVTDPDGRQAVSEVGKAGEKLTLSGPGGGDPRIVARPEDLKDDEAGKDLLLQASVSTTDTVQDFLRNGGTRALGALHGLSAGADALPLGKALQVFGKDAVQSSLQGAKGSVSSLGGAAGVVAGGMQLAQGIREHNVSTLFQGLADVGVGALDLYNGTQSFRNAIKGVSDFALDASEDAARLADGWLGKATGLGKLAETSAGTKVLGAIKGLGGAANVAGALVGTGLGIKDIVDGARSGDGAQIAKGAVSIAGGLGGAAAAIAAGSAFGGPIGAAVGAVVGFFTWGINKLIDVITDKKHKIAGLQIG